MSLQSRHVDRGLQLGIGVVAPSTFVPFNKSNLERGSDARWALSSLKKRDRMYFSGMRILQYGDARDLQTRQSGHQLDKNSDEVMYPVDGQCFWDRLLQQQDQGSIMKDVHLRPSGEIVSLSITDATGNFFVPSSLVSKIAKGEISMTSDDGHRKQVRPIRESSSHTKKDFKAIDPTKKRQLAIAQLLPVVDARLDKEPTTLLINIKGPTDSDLSLQTLVYDQSSGLYEKHGTPTVISLFSRIKHIEIPSLSKHVGKYPNLFAVITNNKVHVIRLDRFQPDSIELTEFEPLEFRDFEQFPIVHVTFNPWNHMEMALIDSKGNWCIAKLETHKRQRCNVKLRREISGSIFDPTEISPWNHIEWQDDHTSLIILNRSRLTVVNLEQNWQQDIIQAKTWSELRDFKRITDNLFLLLTSKEIILMQVRDQHIDRLLSWKHEWDPLDPSIRTSFKICEDDEYGQLIHILLYSKLTVKVYGILFGYKENNWSVIASKPFLLSLGNIKSKDGLNTIEFPDVNLYAIPSDSDEGDELSKDFLCVTGFVGSDTVVQGFLSTTESSNHIQLDLEHPTCDYSLLFLNKISTLFNQNLPVAPADYRREHEYQMFQQYGYAISEKLNEQLELWKKKTDKCNLNIDSLGSLKTFSSYFQNVSEYASLIEQLITYYKEHDLTFSDTGVVMNQLWGEKLNSWEAFFNRLLVAWDIISPGAEDLCRLATEDMALSLISYQNEGEIKNTLAAVNSEISKSMKGILDVWDNDFSESQNNVQSTHSALFPTASSQLFQIPTVKSSQQAPAKNKPSPSSKLSNMSVSQPTQPLTRTALPGNMAPAFSLGANLRSTQPMTTLSQPESGQRAKRKKKKVGGFN
ncbi:unnamed protein product [Kluyveromyces dobzhanskii CBS 2104]|uniref:WGS project CCBQ000000000 data, contig 00014 n=1 Tax=Kluyveromyces dobzhanskii CBS 2104 TaxID=1427455 RepID=A0A0A8L8W5_9SACH|nr:unnamed protein product [Kluyveromyces dobzhanskii CBS 2104]